MAELPPEALISQRVRLRDWVAQHRQDVRFARRLNEAAEAWKGGTGGLWRPPELDLLLRYAAPPARPDAAAA